MNTIIVIWKTNLGQYGVLIVGHVGQGDCVFASQAVGVLPLVDARISLHGTLLAREYSGIFFLQDFRSSSNDFPANCIQLQSWPLGVPIRAHALRAKCFLLLDAVCVYVLFYLCCVLHR